MHKIGLKLTIAQHGEIQLSRIQVNDGIFRKFHPPKECNGGEASWY